MLTKEDAKKFDKGVEWFASFLLKHQAVMSHNTIRDYQALLMKAQIIQAWVKKQTEQKEQRP